MPKFFLIWICLLVADAQADLSEIEKQCSLMYKKRWRSEKIKNVCFCVTRNIHARFDKFNIDQLTSIYQRRNGRYEASKSDALKALVEFDYFAHANCQKDPLWKFPQDDIGRPDETTD